jgi:hypothetical protein
MFNIKTLGYLISCDQRIYDDAKLSLFFDSSTLRLYCAPAHRRAPYLHIFFVFSPVPPCWEGGGYVQPPAALLHHLTPRLLHNRRLTPLPRCENVVE